jgi:chloramphenicol 3-O phosphotransferase
VLDDAVKRLAGLPVLFVGVVAPIDVIMARRNADPRGGYYAAGDQIPAPVRLWQDAPHAHGAYDLTIDTSEVTPEQAAAVIGAMIQNWPEQTAFGRR